MPTDEPIKLILCELLQNLCDCQLESRVEHVVRFAESYVQELQHDQRKRGTGTEPMSAKVMRELRTPSDKQVSVYVCIIMGECDWLVLLKCD